MSLVCPGCLRGSQLLNWVYQHLNLQNDSRILAQVHGLHRFMDSWIKIRSRVWRFRDDSRILAQIIGLHRYRDDSLIHELWHRFTDSGTNSKIFAPIHRLHRFRNYSRILAQIHGFLHRFRDGSRIHRFWYRFMDCIDLEMILGFTDSGTDSWIHESTYRRVYEDS